VRARINGFLAKILIPILPKGLEFTEKSVHKYRVTFLWLPLSHWKFPAHVSLISNLCVCVCKGGYQEDIKFTFLIDYEVKSKGRLATNQMGEDIGVIMFPNFNRWCTFAGQTIRQSIRGEAQPIGAQRGVYVTRHSSRRESWNHTDRVKFPPLPHPKPPCQRISEQNLIEINTKCNLIRPFAAHTHSQA